MTQSREYGYPVAVTVLFWTSIVTGLSLHGLVEISSDHFRRGMAWKVAWDTWQSHLFLPGYNAFLLAAMQAAPFIVFAVTVQFFLVNGWRLGETVFRKRLASALIALACGLAFALWGLVSIASSSSSTSAIGYVFLPFPVMCVLAAGYFAGFLLTRLWR